MMLPVIHGPAGAGQHDVYGVAEAAAAACGLRAGRGGYGVRKVQSRLRHASLARPKPLPIEQQLFANDGPVAAVLESAEPLRECRSAFRPSL